MRHLIAILSLCATAWAGQSLVVGASGTPPVVTLPNSAPWTTIGANTHSMRWEMRFHGLSGNLPVNGLLYGAAQMYQDVSGNKAYSGSGAYAQDWDDRAVINGCCAGLADILVRIQRDVVAQHYTIEVWNTQTGSYLSAVGPTITAWGPTSWAGVQMSPVTGEDTAFFRWYSSVVPMGTPVNLAGTGDLADYEFEGNLTDASGHGLNMSAGTATVSYVATPTYAPSCVAGAFQVFRAGHSGTLMGFGTPLDGGSTITYIWTQTAGPTATIASPTSASTSVTAPSFGDYTFQLACTDGSAQTTTATVEDGAVPTDDNSVVTGLPSSVQTLIGPVMRWGANPWPWSDTIHLQDANLQIANRDTYYSAWWDVADAGTVAITLGSISPWTVSTVTGTGTTFKATFCGGGTSGINSMVVWYPIAGGGTGRRSMGVSGCTDDTHLTLSAAWSTDVPDCTAGGCSYSDDANSSIWAYGSAPANYYDNVAGLYALYYQTGLTTYLTNARILADRWWESPETDRGNAYTLFGGFLHGQWGQGKDQAIMGLALRALDGHPEMWTGLHEIAAELYAYNYDPAGSYTYNQLPSVYDERNTAYYLASISYCALYDTNSAEQTECQGWVNSAISGYFTTGRFADGSWRDFAGTYDLTTTVKVTNGSTTVDGNHLTNGCGVSADTAWTAGEFAVQSGDITTPLWMWGNPIPSTRIPVSNTETGADPAIYTPAWVSATSVTLDRPYAGTTGCHGWAIGYPYGVGWGAPPYMEGMLAEAFNLAGKALASSNPATSATAYGYGVDAARWIMNNGYRASTKSVYYTAGYMNCKPPIPETGTFCTEDYDADGARVISADAMGGITAAATYSNDAILKAFAALLYNAMWAKPTTCPVGSAVCIPDGSYWSEWDEILDYPCWGTNPCAPKWFGQGYGYPARGVVAGILGLAPPSIIGVSISGSMISGSRIQ